MRVIVVAPHPDDETLGCGGTILKHINDGCDVFWLIMTSINEHSGYSSERTMRRKKEIDKISAMYRFKNTYIGSFCPSKLDQCSKLELVRFVSDVFLDCEPNIIYFPFPGDIHSDHFVTYDAVKSCTKSFRYPSVKALRLYETLSETEFGLLANTNGFRPNVYISIDSYLEKKIEIMKIYESEIGQHPFPRSIDAIRAQAILRGSVAGVVSAEAFMNIREIIR